MYMNSFPALIYETATAAEGHNSEADQIEAEDILERQLLSVRS